MTSSAGCLRLAGRAGGSLARFMCGTNSADDVEPWGAVRTPGLAGLLPTLLPRFLPGTCAQSLEVERVSWGHTSHVPRGSTEGLGPPRAQRLPGAPCHAGK